MNNSDFNMNDNVNDINNINNIDNTNYAGNMRLFEEQEENNYDIVYDDTNNNFKNFINNNKKLVILVIAIIIMLILLLIVTSLSNKGKLESVVINSDDIIYIGDFPSLEVSSSGSNLDKTSYTFKLNDNSLATLKETTMKGKDVVNTITPLTSGNLTIEVTASLGKTIVNEKKNILICKKLSNDSVIIKELTLKKGNKFYLKDNLSLGVSGCSNNLTYSSSDNSVLSIDNGIASANKKGSASIKVSDGNNTVSYTIKVS